MNDVYGFVRGAYFLYAVGRPGGSGGFDPGKKKQYHQAACRMARRACLRKTHMHDESPQDPRQYREQLQKIRARRRLLWLVILIYLPAMMFALHQPDYKTWAAAVFITWIILLIVAVALACVIRCPRCGECFHTHGPTFLPFRRCLHCALHVNADKRGPETDERTPRFRKKS